MTNSETVINGVSLKETIEELELLFDEFHNDEFCTLARSRDYMEALSEENTKLKAKIEQLKIDYKDEMSMANEYTDIMVTQRKEIEQLKAELEQSAKLPCKIGDIVYTTNWLRSQVFKNITTGFQVYDGETFILTYEGLRISDKNMGSHLFLTREEAEQSLKGQVEE